jgi:hypothetical protein
MLIEKNIYQWKEGILNMLMPNKYAPNCGKISHKTNQKTHYKFKREYQQELPAAGKGQKDSI